MRTWRAHPLANAGEEDQRQPPWCAAAAQPTACAHARLSRHGRSGLGALQRIHETHLRVRETHLQLIGSFVRPWPVPQSKHNSRLYKIGGPIGHGHDYNPYDRTDDGVTWMLGESVDVSPSRPPQLSHLPSPVAPPRTTPGAGPSGSAPVDADNGPPASRTRSKTGREGGEAE